MTGKLKIVAAALLFLGVCMVLVALFSRSAPQQIVQTQQREEITFPVVVAKSAIVFGEPVSAEMVAIEQVKTKPEGVFTDINDVIGRIPILSVQQGKTLSNSIFESNAVSEQVRTGYRAVAIRIDEQLAGTGKLKPGDIVDVFSVFRRDDRDVMTTQSRLVLSRLRVITVGAKVVGQAPDESKGQDGNNNPNNNAAVMRNVTVEVPVADVNLLLLSQQQGNLLLALRNAEDNAVPSRDEFPEPTALLKKKDIKGKPPTDIVLSADDKAFAGLGLDSVVGVGKTAMPVTAPAPRPDTSGAKTKKENREETPKTEMIRRGKATSEVAQ
jgi:pilus assembly protein CpaB